MIASFSFIRSLVCVRALREKVLIITSVQTGYENYIH